MKQILLIVIFLIPIIVIINAFFGNYVRQKNKDDRLIGKIGCFLVIVWLLVLGGYFITPSPEPTKSRYQIVIDSLDATYQHTHLKSFCNAFMEFKLLDEEARLRTKKRFGDSYNQESRKFETRTYDSLYNFFSARHKITEEKIHRDIVLTTVDLGRPCYFKLMYRFRRNEIIEQLNRE